MKMTTRKIVILAMLTAFAIVVGIFESFIPSIGIPGIKLGLANIFIIVTLYELGILEALFVDLAKVFLVSLLRGAIFSMGFFMSLAGALLSLGVMILFYLLVKKFSVIGVSVIGSIFHVTGQILVAIIYLSSQYILFYLPIIGVAAIVTGVIVGLVARLILKTEIIKNQKEKYDY